MAVKHLGQFAQPRESDLSGLSEGISKGLGLREQRKTREASTQAAEAGINLKKQQLTSELAKVEREEEDKNRKLAEDSWNRLSLRLMGKSEAEQQTVLESPSIKQLGKDLIKDNLPEAYDVDTQRIIPKRLEWFPQTPEDKLEFQKQSEEVSSKIKAGAPMTASNLVTWERNMILANTLGMMDKEEMKKQMEKINQLRNQMLQKGESENDLSGALGAPPSGGDMSTGDWWNK